MAPPYGIYVQNVAPPRVYRHSYNGASLDKIKMASDSAWLAKMRASICLAIARPMRNGISRVGVRGGSNSHKMKYLVKVVASKGVIRVD